MKKIYLFLSAALLLSATASAQVAKVGTTDYTDIKEAIAAWKTSGGELTILADCEYNTATSDTITKASILNLNGKTLTWNSTYPQNAVVVGADLTVSGGGTVLFNQTALSGGFSSLYVDTKDVSLVLNGVSIVTNQTNAKKKPGCVVKVYAAAKVDVFNSTITMQNNCFTGIYLKSNAQVIRFESNTITYMKTQSSIYAYGQCYGVDNEGTSLNSVNNKIDLSAFPTNQNNEAVAVYLNDYYGSGLVLSFSGDKGEYVVNEKTSSISVGHHRSGNLSNNTISIESGLFVGPTAVTATSISGGKFSVKPAESALASGYIYKQVGGDGEDKDYYTVAVDEGQVVASLYGEYYFSEEELWKAVGDDWYTITLYTTKPITIPAGRTVILEAHDATKEYNIANNGIVYLQSTFLANFTTKGEIHVQGNGVYPETYYNNYVKGNVDEDNPVYFDEDAKKYHVVNSRVVAIYGETPTTSINDAFSNVKDGETIALMKNVAMGTARYTISGGKHISLNLNGHTLSGAYGKNGLSTLVLGSLHIQNATLTVKNGTIKTIGTPTVDNVSFCFFYLYGDTENPNVEDYSVLTLAEDVTVEIPIGTAVGVMYRTDTNNEPIHQAYGVKVNIYGTINGQSAVSVSGVLSNKENNVPVIHIYKGAKMNVTEGAIYAAGYAEWNFAGDIASDNFGVEIRAGEFTMGGGSIVSTATAPADDQFNGSGSTSQACGIAVCQHSTKLPITVVVNDGYIKAYTPLYQSNPQNNETDMTQINVNVYGGKFFSTSKNIVWSLNKRIFLHGGLYNQSPSAYAAEDKVVVDNDDETTKGEYPYKIGDKATTAVTFSTDGAWNVAGNWQDTIATSATSATINANVVIGAGVRAEAYGIKVNTGKTITIKDGGVLVVGKDGISGITSADQLIINDGGALVFSPVATLESTQVLSTSEIKTTVREVKEAFKNYDATYEYIWKNIALPVKKSGMGYSPRETMQLNVWNNKWDPVTTQAEFVEKFGIPFNGYHITVHEDKAADIQNPTYQFTGNLNGNVDVYLEMHSKGFHLFGNSWSAPLDVREILNQIEHFTNSQVNAGIKIYISDKCTLGGRPYYDGSYVDITRARLSADAEFAKDFSTLGAHECFFLYSNTDSETGVTLNYEKAVWNVALANASSKSSAPRRVDAAEAETTRVDILLTADNGRWDNVLLYEGEPLGSQKMLNEGAANVNIYAVTAKGNYSTVGAESLLGTELAIQTNGKSGYTLSFGKVQGEALYLKDLATGIVTEMSEGNTYTFTAEPNTTATRFRVVSRSEVTTGVEDLTAETTATARGIYSVTGQYLGTADQLPTLPAGVYIINGKKVVK